MQLHNNPQLFKQAIRAASRLFKLQTVYIEKDYWVTYALHSIFHNDIGKETVFKGGTALSKCFGLIERFSEDIDLVVIKSGDETDNQLKKKIKTVTNAVNEIMPETVVKGITVKRGMNRKTGHTYPKVFEGDYGQVRDVVIVEATWLGYFEPYSTSVISSFIYDMMVKTGQQEIAKEYDLLPFEVNVLDTRRTICEKIMSLVRFSYTEQPFVDLSNKVRHTYDLHQLFKKDEINNFFVSKEFDSMLLRVAQDDVASFRNNNQWLVHHPNQSLFFTDVELTWEQIHKSYFDTFAKLVYGELPVGDDIVQTLKSIKERLQSVEWTIKID